MPRYRLETFSSIALLEVLSLGYLHLWRRERGHFGGEVLWTIWRTVYLILVLGLVTGCSARRTNATE